MLLDLTSRPDGRGSPTTATDQTDDGASGRRIWEIEEDALFVVLGVLLDRAELEALFWEATRQGWSEIRDDVLLLDAVHGCSQPSRFAETVEHLLDERTASLRGHVGGCAMFELAGSWLRTRECATGKHLAAVLWSLARDGRWVIRGLQGKVRGDIWVKALRLLGSGYEPPKAMSEPPPLTNGQDTLCLSD